MPFNSSEDLERAKAELVLQGSGKFKLQSLLRFMRIRRELGVKEYEAQLEYGSALIANFPRRMGTEERWQVHEEVALAAFVCGKPDIGEQVLQRLQRQFPNSYRVKCLRGMALESVGQLDEAGKMYDAILEEKPTYPEALKRKVGFYLTKGNISQAISAASKYLDIYQMDHAMWEQLHHLYVQAKQVSSALYCLEEALLYNPGSTSILLQVGDLYFSQGGLENVSIAVSYYSRVIELTDGDEPRALYGVLSAVSALQGVHEIPSSTLELADLAAFRLKGLYSQRAPGMLRFVEKFIHTSRPNFSD